jgi:hypothetical protein
MQGTRSPMARHVGIGTKFGSKRGIFKQNQVTGPLRVITQHFPTLNDAVLATECRHGGSCLNNRRYIVRKLIGSNLNRISLEHSYRISVLIPGTQLRGHELSRKAPRFPHAPSNGSPFLSRQLGLRIHPDLDSLLHKFVLRVPSPI